MKLIKSTELNQFTDISIKLLNLLIQMQKSKNFYAEGKISN